MRSRLLGVVAVTGLVALAACGGDDADLQAFCDRVEELRALESPFEAGGEDLDAAKAALEDARKSLDEVAEVAPGEIEDDVQATSEFFDRFVDSIQDADTPEQFLRAATEFQGEAAEFQETADRLEQFTTENCGDE